jgi:hypothetical protein
MPRKPKVKETTGVRLPKIKKVQKKKKSKK